MLYDTVDKNAATERNVHIVVYNITTSYTRIYYLYYVYTTKTNSSPIRSAQKHRKRENTTKKIFIYKVSVCMQLHPRCRLCRRKLFEAVKKLLHERSSFGVYTHTHIIYYTYIYIYINDFEQFWTVCDYVNFHTAKIPWAKRSPVK